MPAPSYSASTSGGPLAVVAGRAPHLSSELARHDSSTSPASQEPSSKKTTLVVTNNRSLVERIPLRFRWPIAWAKGPSLPGALPPIRAWSHPWGQTP